MTTNKDESSRSRTTASKVLFAAMKILREAGGELPGREVINQIEKSTDLTPWERETLAKSGYIRWQSILHFFTIDAIKAGFLRKKKGTWYLTPEGDKAVELGGKGFFDKAREGYRKWREENPKQTDETVEPKTNNEIAAVALSKVEEDALEGFREYVNKKNPYEFQDLVAALMRGMGYHVPVVASPGKDGGVDIVAYQDPLGTKAPRLKIQVKHRPETSAPVQEIRQLMGLLTDSDVGIFVSTGGFTSDAKSGIRNAKAHVELIDFERFISLWQENYSKLPDEDKKLLPMQPIFFLAPEE